MVYRCRKWDMGDTSSNPGRGLLQYHIVLIHLGKGMNPIILPPAMGKIVGTH